MKYKLINIKLLIIAIVIALSGNASTLPRSPGMQEQLAHTLTTGAIKCPFGGAISADFFSDPEYNLKIFISFSVPKATWKELSAALEKVGGTFILRGLPNNSFQEFAAQIKSLRQEGILAPIIIDPESFTKFDIQVTPSIVLTHDQYSDKIVGNISLLEAMRIISEEGDTKTLAKQLYGKLQGANV